MSYIDGFLLAVPTANKEAFREMATGVAQVFKEHGALSVVECWGDDLPEGKVNSMHSAVLRKPGETVVFSWIVWPSKAVRDAGSQKVREDPRLHEGMDPNMFDGKRMIFGGFEVIVDV